MLKKIDRPFLITVIILVVAGFFIFTSASLGLLARDGARFSSVAFSQFFLGIFLGAVALLITTKIKYTFWRKYAFYIFIASAIATLLVFLLLLSDNISTEFFVNTLKSDVLYK